MFVSALVDRGLPKPKREFKYAKNRKLRVDFAYPEKKFGIEIDGGIYSRQAHGSISGILNDIERNNQAALNGWTIIRIPSDKCLLTKYIDLVEKVYKMK